MLLISLINQSLGLSMPYHIVLPECSDDARAKRSSDEFLTDASYGPDLKRALIGRIEALRNSEAALHTTESVGALLYNWERWGDGAHAGSWLLENRANDELMWGFLFASVSWNQDMPDRGIASVSIEWLTKFLPLEELDAIIAHLRNRDIDAKKRSFLSGYDTARARFAAGNAQPE
jgi:hypothetical protein